MQRVDIVHPAPFRLL